MRRGATKHKYRKALQKTQNSNNIDQDCVHGGPLNSENEQHEKKCFLEPDLFNKASYQNPAQFCAAFVQAFIQLKRGAYKSEKAPSWLTNLSVTAEIEQAASAWIVTWRHAARTNLHSQK